MYRMPCDHERYVVELGFELATSGSVKGKTNHTYIVLRTTEVHVSKWQFSQLDSYLKYWDKQALPNSVDLEQTPQNTVSDHFFFRSFSGSSTGCYLKWTCSNLRPAEKSTDRSTGRKLEQVHFR